MKQKHIGILLLLFIIGYSPLFSQEKNKILNFGHKLTIGNYNSYTNDNIGIIEAGYDFVLNFPYLNENYNLMDYGIGLSGLFAFDGTENLRSPVLGLGVNGGMRLFSQYFWKTRVFLEGIMSLVIYSKEYPENGTIVNGGWHLGGGLEYSINGDTNIFMAIRWFHTSNNDIYGRDRNPSINAVGIGIGLILK